MKRSDHVMEFNKLKDGINILEFSLDSPFMEKMGGHLEQLHVRAVTTVMKSTNMYHVDVELKGTVVLECDTCLDEYTFPVNGHAGFIIKLSEMERYDDDEIVYITPATIDFDLSQFLFDSMMLSIPLKKVCEQGGKACNEAVISKLEHQNEEFENEAGEVDPVWDKLKGLIDEKEENQ